MAKITDELLIRIHALVDGQGDVRELERAIAELETQAKKPVPDPSNGVGDAAPAAANKLKELALAVAGLLAALGAASAVSGIVETGKAFENLTTQLTTIEGSGEKANQSLAWIAEFTAKTPFELLEVAEAFRKLKAFGLDPIANDTLRILGDTASAMGKTLNDAVEALADAVTGEFERLKEFGVKASQEGEKVRFAYTKNGQAMVVEAEKNSAAIQKALLEGIFNEKYAGGMAALSQTLSGTLSNLSDQWTAFERAIGDAGFFELVKQQANDLQKEIQKLSDSGELRRWAQEISDALSAVVIGLRSAAGFIRDHAGTLVELGKLYLYGKVAIIGYNAALVAYTAATAAATGATVAQAVATRTSVAASTNLAAGLKGAAAGLVGIVAALAIDQWVKAADAISQYYEQVKKLEQAQRDLGAQQAFGADRARKISADTLQYRDTLVLSAVAVEGLAREERSRYTDSLDGARKYYDAQALLAKQVGDTVGFNAANAAARKYAAALAEAEPIIKRLTTLDVSGGLGAGVEKLIVEFGNLYKESGRVSAALDKLLEPLQRGDLDFATITNITAVLGELERKGKATGREIVTAINAALKDLSTDELDRLEQKLAEVPVTGVPAFDAVRQAVKAARSEIAEVKPIKISVDTADLSKLASITDVGTAMRALEAQLQSGEITAEQYAEGMTKIGQAIDEMRRPAEAQAAATGELAAAHAAAAAAAEEQAQAEAAAAKEAEESAAAAERAAARYVSLGDAARQNAEAIISATEGAIKPSAAALEKLSETVGGGVSSLEDYRAAYARSSIDVAQFTASVAAQSDGFRALEDRIKNAASLTERELADAARQAAGGFSLLNETSLEQLRGQIEAATQANRNLVASVEDAIFAEEQRRRRLQGDDLAAKQADFAKAEAELRKQINDAENADLKQKLAEQLQILKANNDLELKQLREKEAERKKIEQAAEADREKQQQDQDNAPVPPDQAPRPPRPAPRPAPTDLQADADIEDRLREELHQRELKRIATRQAAGKINLTLGFQSVDEIYPELERRILRGLAERQRLRG